MCTVTAECLRTRPKVVAPKSGLRCAGCGHSARRDKPMAIWTIYLGNAYCKQCMAKFSQA